MTAGLGQGTDESKASRLTSLPSTISSSWTAYAVTTVSSDSRRTDIEDGSIR